MDASDLIVWAIFIGLALNILFSMTGLDDLLANIFGQSKTNELELRVIELEERLSTLESKSN
ncbi:hypothetical protein [Thalassotalea fusca]